MQQSPQQHQLRGALSVLPARPSDHNVTSATFSCCTAPIPCVPVSNTFLRVPRIYSRNEYYAGSATPALIASQQQSSISATGYHSYDPYSTAHTRFVTLPHGREYLYPLVCQPTGGGRNTYIQQMHPRRLTLQPTPTVQTVSRPATVLRSSLSVTRPRRTMIPASSLRSVSYQTITAPPPRNLSLRRVSGTDDALSGCGVLSALPAANLRESTSEEAQETGYLNLSSTLTTTTLDTRQPDAPPSLLGSLFSFTGLASLTGALFTQRPRNTSIPVVETSAPTRSLQNPAATLRQDVRGIPLELLEMLPVDKHQTNARETGSQSTCLVCQLDYVDQDMCKRLPCLHHFHAECIDRWLMTRRSCPVCRLCVVESLRQSDLGLQQRRLLNRYLRCTQTQRVLAQAPDPDTYARRMSSLRVTTPTASYTRRSDAQPFATLSAASQNYYAHCQVNPRNFTARVPRSSRAPLAESAEGPEQNATGNPPATTQPAAHQSIEGEATSPCTSARSTVDATEPEEASATSSYNARLPDGAVNEPPSSHARQIEELPVVQPTSTSSSVNFPSCTIPRDFLAANHTPKTSEIEDVISLEAENGCKDEESNNGTTPSGVIEPYTKSSSSLSSKTHDSPSSQSLCLQHAERWSSADQLNSLQTTPPPDDVAPVSTSENLLVPDASKICALKDLLMSGSLGSDNTDVQQRCDSASDRFDVPGHQNTSIPGSIQLRLPRHQPLCDTNWMQTPRNFYTCRSSTALDTPTRRTLMQNAASPDRSPRHERHWSSISQRINESRPVVVKHSLG